jgi:hypothetical protein
MKKANASAKLKEVFAIPLADTKTPHLILPDRSESPPTTRLHFATPTTLTESSFYNQF